MQVMIKRATIAIWILSWVLAWGVFFSYAGLLFKGNAAVGDLKLDSWLESCHQNNLTKFKPTLISKSL